VTVKKKFRLILGATLIAVGIIAVVQAPASASPAVTVNTAEATQLITAAVERGETVYSHADTATGLTTVIRAAALTNVWGCPAGVGCIYTAYFGTGASQVLNVGTFGTYTCWNINGPNVGNNTTSSATADYGSGLDLDLFDVAGCDTRYQEFVISTGFHVTFQGSSAWFDNKASSFMIANVI
jgi:hypothetical protein